MNINSLLKMEVLVVIILIISSIVGYFIFKKYKNKLSTNIENIDNQLNIPSTVENNQLTDSTNLENNTKPQENTDIVNKKIIQYYGGHHCPHSNKDSNMYKLITENFSKKYNNVEVKVYWGSEPTHEKLFQQNNVQYVPTILNSKNEVVNVGLDENVDKINKSPEELEHLLFEGIYNQL